MLFQHDITRDARFLKERFWDENPASDEIREYAGELVEGTLSRLTEIDTLLSRYAENWTLSRMGRVDRNILRLAIYELLYRDDVPARVTINEAITIAKKYSEEISGAFINGILDRILREEERISGKREEAEKDSEISFGRISDSARNRRRAGEEKPQ
jgi:N utilization substance protein B